MIPGIDAERVRRWAAGRVPPERRDQVGIEVDETPRDLTILECRAPWSEMVGPGWTRKPIARLSYAEKRSQWTLYQVDGNGRFQRYREHEPSRHVGELLDEIDADPSCVFWG